MALSPLLTNIIATLAALVLCIIWLRTNDALAHRGLISGPLSRKIIHIGTGPLFVLTWLIFNDAPSARWLAALVPLAITAQFALVGLGVMRDPAAVKAMSRTGDRREILRGPLLYGVVFVVLTLVYWKESPIGIVALMLLCGGDGLADILGKRLRTAPLPWSPRKTWGGMLGMLLGGWLLSLILVAVYLELGLFKGGLGGYWAPISIIALVGTLVESLPVQDLDNVSVPLAAVLLGHLLF